MALRDIAIVGTAQRPSEVNSTFTSVEILLPVIQQLLDKVGIERSDIGFWCHGSCDYMSGQPFSFVSAVDAIGGGDQYNASAKVATYRIIFHL